MTLLFFGNPYHQNDGLGYFLYKSLEKSKIITNIIYVANLNSIAYIKRIIQKENDKIILIDSIKVAPGEEGKIFFYEFIFSEEFLDKLIQNKNEVFHNEVVFLFFLFLLDELKKKKKKIILYTVGIEKIQPFRIGIDANIRISLRILKKILIKEYLYDIRKHKK